MSLRGLAFLWFVALWLAPLSAFAMKITSPSFSNGQPLPRECGYRYQNRNPELRITEVPAQARALALIMDDPDAPRGTFVHWLVWNLPPTTSKLSPGELPAEARTGRNHFGDNRYDGPAPPSGTHRYFFRLFALDSPLALPAGADRKALEKAMEGHIVATTTLMGTFTAER
ncbi:Putative lipoprotein LppC [Methylacidimicrobium cyclopophantes]|uniref:Lipoprotein LppC n=1 Tax=Methylacidimicrobium cyclopophantes TaxID=1041766 RepID=A0A5E6MG55_9BACT|nr:YbhB/YbcL family Raf kinase inhibitor-like protein [Methylacidimicrobium cyclopophantes]VVM04523.1 Putative lipoprotein LppC [Methylacidimicrobium cyclopophantes]